MTQTTAVTVLETTLTPNVSFNSTDIETDSDVVVVDIVLKTIMIVVGIIGNILTIMVLSNKRNRKVSTAILYMCLAISDLLVIIFVQIFEWIYRVFDVVVKKEIGQCNTIDFIQITVLETSAWLVAIITLERVVYVKYPFKARTLSKRRYAIATTFCTTILISCSNIVEIIGQDGYCRPETDAFRSFFKFFVYYKTIVVQWGIPCVIITIGNIVIYSVLKGRPVIKAKSTSNDNESSIARRLLLVSAAFIITMTPGAVYIFLRMHSFAPYNENVWIVLINLSNLNASINFILYMLQGSRFRKDVIELFICCGQRRSVSTINVRNTIQSHLDA